MAEQKRQKRNCNTSRSCVPATGVPIHPHLGECGSGAGWDVFCELMHAGLGGNTVL